jgi:3'-5' exonuclease
MTGYLKTPSLLEKIQETLKDSDNPFILALQFFGNANMVPKTNSLSFAIIEAMDMLREKLEPSVIEKCLDDNTKHVAFHFMQDKNLSCIKKTVTAFELVKSKEIFVNPIRRLIKRQEFKNAGQFACELQLFNKFGLHKFLIPLFLEDRMVIFDNYIRHSPDKQAKAVQFLDGLLAPPLSVREKCEDLLLKHQMKHERTERFTEKSVNTTIERLVKMFGMDERRIAPLHYKFKISKQLGFVVNAHFKDKKSSVDAFQDQLTYMCIDDKIDLQIELVERLVGHSQLRAAEKYAKQYNVSMDKLPEDLQKFMNCEMTKKLNVETASSLGESSSSGAAAPSSPEQQVPEIDNGWSDDEKEDAEPEPEDFYELSIDPSSIVMIDTVNLYHEMFSDLKDVKEVAIDTEFSTWNSVSILQIATRENKVYIVDILGLQKLNLDDVFWNMLGRRIFNNKEIIKNGFDIAKDVQMLRKVPKTGIEPVTEEGYRDLKVLGMDVFKVLGFKYPHHEEGIKALGLSKLTKLCFGKKLDKGNQLSNWSLRPLRYEQITYAATDALVLFKIHDVIVETLKKLGIDESELKDNLFE